MIIEFVADNFCHPELDLGSVCCCRGGYGNGSRIKCGMTGGRVLAG